jgi:hypothetical protein
MLGQTFRGRCCPRMDVWGRQEYPSYQEEGAEKRRKDGFMCVVITLHSESMNEHELTFDE